MKKPEAAPEIELSEAVYRGKNRAGADVTVGPISLKINGGEFFSILGSSRGNRSILLRMMAGLDLATAGEVCISGRRVESTQQDVGYVFREPSLLDWQTALKNVLIQCEVRRLDLRSCEAEARRLFAAMGLSGCEDLKPCELSTASAQRVSICRALVHNPSLLLMDNPFHNLDGLECEQLVTDLQRLRLTPKMTAVLNTTQISEAVQLSDRIAVMTPAGSVIHMVMIDLPRPRRLDKATTPQIAEYCNSIRTLLHAGGVLY